MSVLRKQSRQRGVSLVAAIFLVVVLASLAVAIVTVTTSQQAAFGLDVQGTRAYLAARSGVEWGLHRQLRSNALCPAASGASSTSSFAMPANTTLSPYTVSVTCSSTVLGALKRYRMRVVACNQPAAGACPNASNSSDYVQRVIQVDFGD
jgi:MSHA biogenesis protein MshP